MKQKKFPSLLLTLFLFFALTIPAMAAPQDGSVIILYTNDIHTYIDNTRKDGSGKTVSALRYSTVAGYRKSIGADFLVDAGDHIQGTSYGTYDKGHTIINLMNAAGYTAATIGNHEFDYDMTGTRNAIDWANFDYVSCNIVDGVAVDYMALEEYVKTFPIDSATGLPTLKAGMGYDAPEGRIVIQTPAEATDSAASPVETRFHFSPTITGGQADAPCTFDPSWFFQSARSNYQSGLARLSIRTAIAAFGTDAVLEADAVPESVRYLSEEAKDSTSANIVRLMRDMGFSGITADYHNPGLDTIGYAIANREISNGKGETARLILIAIRGGGYRQEWASNFTIGLTKEHQGFSEAASKIFEMAQTYLSELREGGYHGAVKFWITGYSRAAAVANLTAQRLTALANTDNGIGFTRDGVFAYCFACPRNVVLDSADALSDSAAYDNIANIVHYADFVPKMRNGVLSDRGDGFRDGRHEPTDRIL